MAINECGVIVSGTVEYVDCTKYAKERSRRVSVFSDQTSSHVWAFPDEFSFDNPPASTPVDSLSGFHYVSGKNAVPDVYFKYLRYRLEAIQFKTPTGNVTIVANRNEPRLRHYDFNKVEESWTSFIKGFPNSSQKVHGVFFPNFIPEYLIYFHEDCQKLGGRYLRIAGEIDSYTKRHNIVISHKKVRQKKAQWKAEKKQFR